MIHYADEASAPGQLVGRPFGFSGRWRRAGWVGGWWRGGSRLRMARSWRWLHDARGLRAHTNRKWRRLAGACTGMGCARVLGNLAAGCGPWRPTVGARVSTGAGQIHYMGRLAGCRRRTRLANLSIGHFRLRPSAGCVGRRAKMGPVGWRAAARWRGGGRVRGLPLGSLGSLGSARRARLGPAAGFGPDFGAGRRAARAPAAAPPVARVCPVESIEFKLLHNARARAPVQCPSRWPPVEGQWHHRRRPLVSAPGANELWRAGQQAR